MAFRRRADVSPRWNGVSKGQRQEETGTENEILVKEVERQSREGMSDSETRDRTPRNSLHSADLRDITGVPGSVTPSFDSDYHNSSSASQRSSLTLLSPTLSLYERMTSPMLPHTPEPTPTLPLTPPPTSTRVLLIDSTESENWDIPPLADGASILPNAPSRVVERPGSVTQMGTNSSHDAAIPNDTTITMITDPHNSARMPSCRTPRSTLSVVSPRQDFVVNTDLCVPHVETPETDRNESEWTTSFEEEKREEVGRDVKRFEMDLLYDDDDGEIVDCDSTPSFSAKRRRFSSPAPEFDVEAQIPLQRQFRNRKRGSPYNPETWTFPVDRVLSPFSWRSIINPVRGNSNKLKPCSNANNNNIREETEKRSQNDDCDSSSHDSSSDSELDVNVEHRKKESGLREYVSANLNTNAPLGGYHPALPAIESVSSPMGQDIGGGRGGEAVAAATAAYDENKNAQIEKLVKIPYKVDMLREVSYSGDDPDNVPTWNEWFYDMEWMPVKIRLRLLERWERTNKAYIAKLWERNLFPIIIYIAVFLFYLLTWIGIWNGSSKAVRDTVVQMGEDMGFIDPDICRRYLNPCSKHGQCINRKVPLEEGSHEHFFTIQCRCNAGYRGLFCEEPRFVCDEGIALCPNNSTCVNLPKGQFFCRCQDGSKCAPIRKLPTRGGASWTHFSFTCFSPTNFCLFFHLLVWLRDVLIPLFLVS